MLLLNDQQVSALLDRAAVKRIVAETFCQHATGQTGLSEPRSQHLRIPGQALFFHTKSAYVAASGVAGFRLAAVSHGQSTDPMRLILLSNVHTGQALALLSETALYQARVAAAIALTVELFRHSAARSLTIVGAGRLALASLLALQDSVSFEQIRVTSRSPKNGEALLQTVADAGMSHVTWTLDRSEACAAADVIVTLTNADEPLVEGRWLRPGSLVVSAGGRQECAPDVLLSADALFVDDWEQCLQLGDIAHLHRAGAITQSRLTATIGEVIAGLKPGRLNDEQRIVAIPQGLTVLDVSLAHDIMRKAQAQGVGVYVDEL